MCGIAGFCGIEENWKSIIEIMINKMTYRGPDDNGVWHEEESGCEQKSVTFGHRRLSIIDLSSNGHQPMMSASKRFVICYNGEIYNYRVIKQELLKEDSRIRFWGTSDTEILLCAFETWGIEETLCKCKGMFAIALYDRDEKKLFLMRDRIGEKPLFYGKVRGKFVFASDLNCIISFPGFQKKIKENILPVYFRYGYIPAPHTIYENIYKLEPGKILEIKYPFKNWGTSSYWTLTDIAVSGQAHLFKGSEEEAAWELERLLKQTIKEQEVADVPVGAFLSAGIDSTTVVSLMQSERSDKVKTFTIGLEDQKYNEADIAKKIAKHLGTDHTEWYVSEKEMQEVIPRLAGMFGEPFADSSQIPTCLVSKLARKDVKVVLSGDGGDELFCGYANYNYVRNTWASNKRLPGFVNQIRGAVLQSRLFDRIPLKQHKGRILSSKTPEELYRNLYLRYDTLSVCNNMADFSSYQYPDGIMNSMEHNLMLMDLLQYHPDDILVKVDRCAMINSLETRIPLLDKDIIEFAWSLPIEYKYSGGMTKRVLRRILYKYVPEKWVDRPKSGFSIPIDKWLKEPELFAWAEHLIYSNKGIWREILHEKKIDNVWNDFKNKGIWSDQIWFLLMFLAWFDFYKI